MRLHEQKIKETRVEWVLKQVRSNLIHVCLIDFGLPQLFSNPLNS